MRIKLLLGNKDRFDMLNQTAITDLGEVDDVSQVAGLYNVQENVDKRCTLLNFDGSLVASDGCGNDFVVCTPSAVSAAVNIDSITVSVNAAEENCIEPHAWAVHLIDSLIATGVEFQILLYGYNESLWVAK